jgi:hypothetical protein
VAGAQPLHLQRQVSEGGEHQRPGELRGGARGAAPGADDDAPPRAGADVDVAGAASGLADQPQARQAGEQGLADGGALADEHQRLGGEETLDESIEVANGVPMDDHLVPRQPGEAGKAANGALVVVWNDHSHDSTGLRLES